MLRPVRWILPLVLLACTREPAREASAGGGNLIIVTGQDADALLPPLIRSSVGKQVSDMLFLPLALAPDDAGLYGDAGYRPVLARSWSWAPDSLSITFALDPRARWSDGRPVRANDVVHALELFRAPVIGSPSAAALAVIDRVESIDSVSVRVHFTGRRPTQFHDAVNNLIPVPSHSLQGIALDSLAASAAARAPVTSGKFRLARWNAGERLELVADTAHWLGRPGLDRISWVATPDPVAQVARLVAGEADMIEVLRGPQLVEAAKDTSLTLVTLHTYVFSMAVFNTRDARRRGPHPVLGDVATRQALSLAVDRTTLVRSVLDSLGLTMASPYLSEMHVPGAAIPPFDPTRAMQLLDSIGWRDSNGDGVRERGGRELALRITAPVSSAPRVRASEIMQQQLKQVGVKVTLQHVEPAVQMTDAAAGRFDITLLGYSGDPSPAGLKQYFGGGLAGSSNHGGFSNSNFDATLDSAASNLDAAAAERQFARAGDVLVAGAPAIWLYEAVAVAGIHKRFQTAAMPARAWWLHLDEWRVDPSRQIDRDRIGLR